MAITKEYQDYLNSDEWKRRRKIVLQDASHTCQECKRKRATQVHHKTYERIFNEKKSDLMAVCAKCHMKIHKIKKRKRKRVYRKFRKMYKRIIGW